MTDEFPTTCCGTPDEFAVDAAFIVSAENGSNTGFTVYPTGGRATF
ncbi:MAG: hypothetical protein ABSE48_03655 [Verrucomicrobiota bacterium]